MTIEQSGDPKKRTHDFWPPIGYVYLSVPGTKPEDIVIEPKKQENPKNITEETANEDGGQK